MITAATVAQLKVLWPELAAVWQEDLRKIHAAMERENDWPEIRALQARAVALRSFIKLPDDLAEQLRLIENSKREGANHGVVELGTTQRDEPAEHADGPAGRDS